MPQEPVVVAAYLSQLHRKTGSPSTVSMAYAALVWLHDVVDVTCSNNPLKNYNTYVLGNKGISYSRCREIFLEALNAPGYNSKLFGLHSLRSGGATAAVTSPSGPVSHRLLKLHGRWKSDYAKDLCIQEDISARLSVSSSLGI